MHKEKEILAILGLILSVIFWVAALFYTLNNPASLHPLDSPGSTPADISQAAPIRRPPSEIEQKALKDAQVYAEKIIDALVKQNNYEFIYNNFDNDVKQKSFENDLAKGIAELSKLFGPLGIATNYNYFNHITTSNYEYITFYYTINYKKENYDINTLIQVNLKVTDIINSKFILNGLQQNPI